uniref:HSF-type DNA-binding domain-containing protein n=1 Tax=Accipiter nisus TaxID=211598 RepID=A0A8B9RUU4_9AVES
MKIMYMTLPKEKKRPFKLQVIHPGQKQGVSILLKIALEKVMFQSIWWDEHGKCIAIYEELFKKEVVSRREPLRISEIKYMKSFTCHLHLHRFTRKQWDFPRSAFAIWEMSMVVSVLTLLFYYKPNFRRDSPHLLIKCKRSFGVKKRTLPAWGAAAEENDLFVAAPGENTQTSAPRNTAAMAQLAFRVLLLQHLLLHQVMLYPPCQIVPFAPGLEFLTFPVMYPASASMQPASASLPAASALFMPGPPHSQMPTYHHCPACTCGPNSGPAGNGLGPQPRVC